MRSALLFALLLAAGSAALSACGGPSQAQIDEAIRKAQEDAAAAEEAADPGPEPVDVALEILQECALQDVGRLLGLLDVFGPLLDESAPFPPFELVDVDPNALAVNWRLDLDGDGTADMLGTFRFLDADGNATLPLTPDEVAALQNTGDLSIVRDVIARLPLGHTLHLSFNQTGAAEIVGLLGITFDGSATFLTGTVNVLALQCTTAFWIRGVTAADLAGAYPVASIPLTVSAAQGMLVGSVIMDGSPAARLVVTYDETPLEFLLDLDAGTIEVPPEVPAGP